MTAITHFLSKPKLTTIPLVLQILGGSLFIAFCAQVQIPLFFSPVPITLQTLAAMLVGAFLGKNKGALSVVAYLGEIALGFPFLAGGVSHPLALVGATGGYLAGMILQAYLTGWFYERRSNRHIAFAFNAFTGLLVLMMGCLWLAPFVGWNNVLWMGCYPFLLGDALKSMVITRVMMYRQRIKL